MLNRTFNLKRLRGYFPPACLLPWFFASLAQATGQPQAPFDDLGMEISAEERAAIQSAIHSAREISRIAHAENSKRYGNLYRRDAHAKATGCVRATFEINGDIPERFRYGIFSKPGQDYKAWIRFSNGDMLVQPDKEPDARGMAVKVLGIDAAEAQGQPIAAELGSTGTQDFIMTNTPAFFNRNIYDYAENMQYLAKLDKTGWFINLWPPRLHLKEMLRAQQTISSKIETPFAAQYFSMLPYQLGETALKFSSRPCAGASYTSVADKSADDFLTRQMASTLESGSACFDFLVQPRVETGNMPLDDATVIWEESESPFIPVARIHIPPQTITGDTQRQFCENLSMNPWHGVGDWQPLGSLNRARRLVYHAVSEFRHTQNRAPREVPADWCIPGAAESCGPQQGLNIRKPRWPLPRCFDGLYQPMDGTAVSSDCGSRQYSARSSQTEYQ
ncbi:catalase family protein [Microbulbifer sp. CAU 1566]|uniref:catalase family protein n=1 Tax=Microbulbifer sp. CAU 1566 TaxID=2933269 RepID=UPI0020060BDC|nr:catalase family protein [Microbulbifer sp. CAU 1566]MCK7597721.1 catalase family protein [Microbulbifer sp. CAU 1566]